MLSTAIPALGTLHGSCLLVAQNNMLRSTEHNAGSDGAALPKRVNAYMSTTVEFPRANAYSISVVPTLSSNDTGTLFEKVSAFSAFGGQKFIFHVFSCLNRGIVTVKLDTTPHSWLVPEGFLC